MSAPRVYLAGPDVFLPDARSIGDRKRAVCARHGLQGVFPLDGQPELAGLAREAQGLAAFAHCERLMRSCDAGLANCTPFRGPSADVGTAVEVGFLWALGRPVFGYTNRSADYADRVAPDGLLVEAFGLADNLMVEGALRARGLPIVRAEAPPGEALTWLGAFEACVRLAARTLRT